MSVIGNQVMEAQRAARRIAGERAGHIQIRKCTRDDVIWSGAVLILAQCVMKTPGSREFQLTEDEAVLEIALQYLLTGGNLFFCLRGHDGARELAAEILRGGRKSSVVLMFRHGWKEVFSYEAQKAVLRYGIREAELARRRRQRISLNPFAFYKETRIVFDLTGLRRAWAKALAGLETVSRKASV